MHIAHDLEFIGLSIVSNPVQKYSVMHNDETLDFTPLEYLSSFLENCFVQWDLEWAKKKFPTETFKRVKQEDNCPCNSGKNFEDCCISQEEIEIPHARFILSKPIPSNIERAIFPY